MADNYDDVCSFCGKSVDIDTLYYCCPECHKSHKEKQNKPDNDKQAVTKESEVKNETVQL